MAQSIRQQLLEISKNEQNNIGMLAKFLAEHKGDIRKLKIRDLTEQSYVSTATATRLAQKMNLSGFNELKVLLSKEEEDNKKNTENYHDKNLEHYLLEMNHALFKTVSAIDISKVNEVVDNIKRARKVQCFAVGGTSMSAKDFCSKLERLNIMTNCDQDSHNQYFQARNLGVDDLAIAISYSGTTKEIIRNLDISKSMGAKTVLITSNHNIDNNKYDNIIYISESETSARNFSITSRTSILAVLDVIYIELLNSDFDKYAQILQANKYIPL